MSTEKTPEYPGKPGPDGPSKYTDEFIKKLASQLADYTARTAFPIWAEFCYNHHIRRQMCVELRRRSQELSDSYDEMMQKQEAFLHKAGVSGKSSSGFIKFLMINNHKRDDDTPYRDKQDHELSGPGGAPLPTNAPVIIFQDSAAQAKPTEPQPQASDENGQ